MFEDFGHKDSLGESWTGELSQTELMRERDQLVGVLREAIARPEVGSILDIPTEELPKIMEASSKFEPSELAQAICSPKDEFCLRRAEQVAKQLRNERERIRAKAS